MTTGFSLQHNRWILASLATGLMLVFAQAADLGPICGLTQSFTQPDEGEARTVLYDDNVVIFSDKFAVNTDGNIRSYSAVDPGGDLCDRPENKNKDPFAIGCAMNTICNGVKMQVAVPGGTETYDYNECGKLIEAFVRLRDAKWSPADGTKIIPVGIEMKDDKPCTTPQGFIVSTASAKSGLGGKACDQKKFLDSAVPSIVVPKCWSAAHRTKNPKECDENLPAAEVVDVQPGDLVGVRGRKTGKVAYAVVGDLGTNLKIGEASIGLHVRARGKTRLPRTKLESYSYDGQELYYVLIFRKSKLNVPLTPQDFGAIDKAAAKRFKRWGGSPGNAEVLLRTCGLAARAE